MAGLHHGSGVLLNQRQHIKRPVYCFFLFGAKAIFKHSGQIEPVIMGQLVQFQELWLQQILHVLHALEGDELEDVV